MPCVDDLLEDEEAVELLAEEDDVEEDVQDGVSVPLSATPAEPEPSRSAESTRARLEDDALSV